MQFDELKEELKRQAVETVRQESGDYFEAVVFNKKLGGLTEVLDKFLGPAAFPSGNKLSPQIERAIDAYGGIQPGQTLYWKQQGSLIFAMLWPWQDKIHTTVKVIQK